MNSRPVGFFGRLARGIRRRCPHCNSRGLFPRFLTMVDDCPGCGLHFERIDGYWIGAMIVATAVTLIAFLAVFVGGILLTWPNVPWNFLLVGTLIVATIIPIVTYPNARTTWVALDLSVRPLEADEIQRMTR